jgi:D-glycero-beta-D-manno-heptose 1-phosphate adenylyltransferase
MKNALHAAHKIYAPMIPVSSEAAVDVPVVTPLQRQVAIWRFLGRRIVFTNGGFDILHRGHIHSLSAAAAEGDILIVGVNTDASVKRAKGQRRPINRVEDRIFLLAALEVVDAVIPFEEDTPLRLILTLKPDVLVKGGDYSLEQIVGAPEVIGWGGRVEIIPFEKGYSTTSVISKIHNL